MLPELRPIWADTPDGVRRAASACAAVGRFALYTEADSLHSYFHKVCLIQVSAGSQHFVVDPLPLQPADLDPLWRVVANPALTVVMHGADYDVRIIDRDYGARVGRLEDTQIMAQLLGEERTGLAHLLEREFGVELDKRHQRADWGARPLAPELVAYAAADTAFLIELAQRLHDRLEALGRRSWAIEECARLAAVRHEEATPDPLAFERVKGARALKGRARDRLHELYCWRDEESRRLDLPPFKVLGNRPMIELAAVPPEGTAELARVPGIGPRFARRWGGEVLRRLEHPRGAPQHRRAQHASPPSATERRRLQRLVEVRDEVAARLGLQPGLVCPRATLQAIAAAPGAGSALNAAGLSGWRRELLGESFVAALTEPS
ncbi:MAG TPA: HRDC domain-containing protein [Thermoanaerobaculales bacterium]|nr:HRDC domain-containing protein [Thermoanaerobaculales bacterium]